MASRLPPVPDGFNGEDFNRARFDRGIEVFSTFLLQIGVVAQSAQPHENVYEKWIEKASEHINSLSEDDLLELLQILDVVKTFRWANLQAIIAMKLAGII